MSDPGVGAAIARSQLCLLVVAMHWLCRTPGGMHDA